MTTISPAKSQEENFNVLATCKYYLPQNTKEAKLYEYFYDKVEFATCGIDAQSALESVKFPRSAALILAQLRYILDPNTPIKNMIMDGYRYVFMTHEQFNATYLFGACSERTISRYVAYLINEQYISTTTKFNKTNAFGIRSAKLWYSLGKNLVINGVKITIDDLLAYARGKPAIANAMRAATANKIYDKWLLKVKRIHANKFTNRHKPVTIVDKSVDKVANENFGGLYNLNYISERNNNYKQEQESKNNRFRSRKSDIADKTVKNLVWNVVNTSTDFQNSRILEARKRQEEFKNLSVTEIIGMNKAVYASLKAQAELDEITLAKKGLSSNRGCENQGNKLVTQTTLEKKNNAINETSKVELSNAVSEQKSSSVAKDNTSSTAKQYSLNEMQVMDWAALMFD
jgi:hypothetical protein